MLKTALVPFLLSCGVYAALGMVKSGSGAAGELWSLYGREMTLHWVMCLPAVLILILSVLRVNVKKAMSVSILAAVVLCIFLRHLDAVTILKTTILGYTASDAEVGAMLNGGGIISMVRVALIVMISSAYSGIFRKTGLLDGLCGRVTALIVPGPCRFLGLFGREDDYVIPWLCCKRIGDDLILVDGPLAEWRTPRKKRRLF